MLSPLPLFEQFLLESDPRVTIGEKMLKGERKEFDVNLCNPVSASDLQWMIPGEYTIFQYTPEYVSLKGMGQHYVVRRLDYETKCDEIGVPLMTPRFNC